MTKTQDGDTVFQIALKDSAELQKAKAVFTNATGTARNKARADVLRLRHDATKELIRLLHSRLRLAADELEWILADLQRHAPEILREIDARRFL